MKERKSRKRWLAAAEAILLFAMVLTIYGSWMAGIAFTDEQDVFYGGYNIVMSGDLYQNYLSQHMPVSYYLAAPAALMGARNIYQFRLYFYVLMGLLWMLLYLRHRGRLNRLALFCLPLLYLFQMKNYTYGTMMVSDHWQGFGITVILLELIRFIRERRISGTMAAFVSLGIVLSFGSAFLSVYPIFMVFLGVIGIKCMNFQKDRKIRKQLVQEDLRLVGFCLLPFALLVGWYLITGNFQQFIDGAYRMNLEIYPRYAQNYNSSVTGSMIAAFPNWWSNLRDSVTQITEQPVTGVIALLQAVSLIPFLIALGKQSWIGAVSFALANVMAGVRSFSGYHNAPYAAACSIPMAFCVGMSWKMVLRKRRLPGIPALAVCAAGVIFIAWPTVTVLPDLADIPILLDQTASGQDNRELLEILTDPGERIHTGDISATSGAVMGYQLRLDDATLASSNPWFYEMYGERELAYLKEHRTKVVLLDPEGMLWGYRVRDYAADLVSYVEEHYIRLAEQTYVHQDAAEEVYQRLEEAGYGLIARDLSLEGTIPWLSQHPGEADQQFFIAEGSELTACWLQMDAFDRNRAGIRMVVVDPEKDEIAGECTLAWDQLEESGWTRFPVEAKLETGRTYVILIFTQRDAEYTLLRFYRTLDNTASDSWYAVNDGLPVDYMYSMRFEYAADERLNIRRD